MTVVSVSVANGPTATRVLPVRLSRAGARYTLQIDGANLSGATIVRSPASRPRVDPAPAGGERRRPPSDRGRALAPNTPLGVVPVLVGGSGLDNARRAGHASGDRAMNAQVIGEAMTTALMEKTCAGHRPSGNGCEEKEAMTRGEVFNTCGCSRRRLWLRIALLIGALIAGARAPPRRSSTAAVWGTHGVFPPAPAQGSIPASYAWLVWNIRTGKVAYPRHLHAEHRPRVCNPGSVPNVEAQIPEIQPAA